MNKNSKKVGRTGTIIGGFNVKPKGPVDPDTGQSKKPLPYHNFPKGTEVKIVGNRREEYLAESNGMKQHIKRKFIKI